MNVPSATEIVLLLLHGQDRPSSYRGILEFHDDDGLWETAPFNLSQPMQPALPPGSTQELPPWEPVPDGTLDVVVDGLAFRVGERGREPWVVSDGTSVWSFERDVEISEVPLLGTRFLERPSGYRDYLPPFRPSWVANAITPPLRWFLEPLSVAEIGGRDPWSVAGQVRAADVLGRPAWVVQVRRSGSEMTLTVEQASGFVLEVRTPTTRVGWSALDSEPSRVPGEFDHDGPTYTLEEELDRGRAEHESQRQAGIDTFARLVGPAEFTVVADVPLDLSVREVLSHDSETGEFSAALAGGHAFLDRSLRGTCTQEDDNHHGKVLRWSTPRYDWTIQGLPCDLTDRGRQAVADSFPPD